MNTSEERRYRNLRKLKPGDRVTVFPIRKPVIIFSIGKSKGVGGEDTELHLVRDSDGHRFIARLRTVVSVTKVK